MAEDWDALVRPPMRQRLIGFGVGAGLLIFALGIFGFNYLGWDGVRNLSVLEHILMLGIFIPLFALPGLFAFYHGMFLGRIQKKNLARIFATETQNVRWIYAYETPKTDYNTGSKFCVDVWLTSGKLYQFVVREENAPTLEKALGKHTPNAVVGYDEVMDTEYRQKYEGKDTFSEMFNSFWKQ